MKPYNLKEILASPASSEVSDGRSGRFWMLEPFDDGSTWIGQWQGQSPWEKHAKGDEFLHVLKGNVEVLIKVENETKSVMVTEGSIFVVPKDHWHQQRAASEVIVLGATPGVTEHSDEEPN